MNDFITQLIDEIGPGHMASTAYDTAWVARLGEIDWDLSSQALSWLAENQLPDGSWGAPAPVYYHDRVISTLAAMIALAHRGRRLHDRALIERGRIALEQMVGNATQRLLSDANGATIGFEMIAPTLVAEAEKLGIIKKQGDRILGRISEQRARKLSLLHGNTITRHVTMAFSAEMAGIDGQHMLDMGNLQEANGSVGLSPSATAYFATYCKKADSESLNYLRQTTNSDGGQPNVFPFDIFEVGWSLWNLSLIPGISGLPNLRPHVDFLSKVWEPKRGVAFSSAYSVKDSDDTAIAYKALLQYGIEKDLASLLAYEEQDYFRCYPLELNPSISVNIHILDALLKSGLGTQNTSVNKILKFLHKTKGDHPFWVDKWHYSPYYPTAHAIIACAGFANHLVEDSVQWILNSQNANGSWGTYISTAEETAYAIQALWVWNENVAKIPRGVVTRASRWLKEQLNKPYPPLWIGKCLYSPRLVVRSAIQSVLTLTS